MENANIGHGSVISADNGAHEDQDLTMASRESAQHATSIQNEAYRHALSELAGELYVEAYKSALQQTLEKQRESWTVQGE